MLVTLISVAHCLTKERILRNIDEMAALPFILLHVMAVLRLLAFFVILERILKHTVIMVKCHYKLRISYGHMSFVKELIDIRIADINAKSNCGWVTDLDQELLGLRSQKVILRT